MDDDLDDESKNSINVSSNVPFYDNRPRQNGIYNNHIQQNGYTDDGPPHRGKFDQDKLMDEIKYLNNALHSKDEEVKNISAHAAAERTRYENTIDELKKRLSISEAEKERAHMSRKQTHELVVESKQKIAEQENEMAELSVKLKTNDAKSLELLAELERTRTMLTDIQHKYHMVERNAGNNVDKQVDTVVRQINERHAAQVDMMQQQINTMTGKLEERENEVKKVMIQYNELQNVRDAMLIDKSDTINQLTHKLEVAQRQCQNMISKSSASGDLEQENNKLRRLVNASEQQMESMQRTISNLTTR